MNSAEIKFAAEKTIEYLKSAKGREEFKKRSAEIDAFFKQLRRDTRPTHEQLHRPFTI